MHTKIPHKQRRHNSIKLILKNLFKNGFRNTNYSFLKHICNAYFTLGQVRLSKGKKSHAMVPRMVRAPQVLEMINNTRRFYAVKSQVLEKVIFFGEVKSEHFFIKLVMMTFDNICDKFFDARYFVGHEEINIINLYLELTNFHY